MNYFDIIFIIILGWSAFRGFVKGLVYEVATLAALLLGIYGAVKFSPVLARFAEVKFNMTSDYLPIITFAATFILIVIIVHFIARMLTKLVKAVSLSFANKISGAVFGLAKSAFFISVILTGINHFNAGTQFIPQGPIDKSVLYKPLSKIAPAVFPYLHFDELKQETTPEEEIVEEEA